MRSRKLLVIQVGNHREDRVVANVVDNFEFVKLLYIQMHVCLRALDALGFDLSAAHLDASINALRDDIQDNSFQAKLDQTLAKDFGELDMFISQTFLAPPIRDARTD